jgi:hypothetical protein
MRLDERMAAMREGEADGWELARATVRRAARYETWRWRLGEFLARLGR